jgi:hypothetical protein
MARRQKALSELIATVERRLKAMQECGKDSPTGVIDLAQNLLPLVEAFRDTALRLQEYEDLESLSAHNGKGAAAMAAVKRFAAVHP